MLSAEARQESNLSPFTARRHAVVSLVSRLLVAQGFVSTALALVYSRKSTGWLVFVLLSAAAVGGLAAWVRTASHSAWLVTLGFEGVYVAVGLLLFGYSSYLGGTLLGIITVGTLLRPSVARAFLRGDIRQPGPLAEQGAGEAKVTASLRF
jgi:hypothetical protein